MPVYVVVNEKEREVFEKKYHLHYGYHTCQIFSELDAAVGYVENLPESKRMNTIVERHEAGDIEIIYRGAWYDHELDYVVDNIDN